MTIGILPVEPVNVKTAPPVTIDPAALAIPSTQAPLNVPYPTAGQEVEIPLPDGTKGYTIKTTSGNPWILGFNLNDTTTKPIHIEAGEIYQKGGMNTVGLSLRVNCATAPETFEIILDS